MADQVIQEIKDRLDIADVIGGYIPLKKAGVNFKALCPFHGEKTPSFVVTPSRQIWHCFGCGEGGDVFTFVQKHENLDFKDTLKLLADKAGVKLPEYRPAGEGGGPEEEKDLLVRINSFSARYYHELLLSLKGGEAKAYAKKRGLKLETVKEWTIGFAPQGYSNLSDALKQKKVKEDDAVKAGVLVRNEKGNVYDRFRGRLTFPVLNYVGDVVGFSARVLPEFDDGKAGKYINSPESPVYNKSRVLFGLHAAKNYIRKLDEAIIVEGQMDCVSAHQEGFKNTVASSGTALTSQHAVMVGRLTKNLKFCFDADAAGLMATRRAVEHLLGQGYNIKIINIAGLAKDPDELIRQNPKAWQAAVQKAEPFFDFYIAKLFSAIDRLSVENKKKIRDEVFPLLAKLNDALELEHYIDLLAGKLETTKVSLMQDFNKWKKPKEHKPIIGAPTVSMAQKSLVEAEKLVLGGILSLPKFKDMAKKESSAEDFSDHEIMQIIMSVFESDIKRPEIMNSTLAKEAIFVLESIKQESASEEAFLKDLTKAFFALRVRTLKQKQRDLQSKIADAENAGRQEELPELQKQFAAVASLVMKYQA
jgi:DNA primase